MAVRRLIAALLLFPVLAACSDDEPGPSGSGDPTTPATSDPTPTETPPPTEPPEAGEKTEAGAKAFVEYWIKTLNYSGANGDTALFRMLGSADCNSCQQIATVIKDIYAEGGRIEGEGWEPRRLRVPVLSGRRAVVRALIRINPQVVRHGDGSAPDRNSGLPNATAKFELSWKVDGWRVSALYQGGAA